MTPNQKLARETRLARLRINKNCHVVIGSSRGYKSSIQRKNKRKRGCKKTIQISEVSTEATSRNQNMDVQKTSHLKPVKYTQPTYAFNDIYDPIYDSIFNR